jgi:AcrR family transcriptional regulator
MNDGQKSVRAKPTPTSARTREQLILAGERLFACHGLDNISLRQINAEAGQRNSSASHYHFGSKESLVAAVYQYRMERIDARRLEMLEQLPTDVAPHPVSSLIGLLVDPVVAEIEDSPGGRYGIRFMAQILGHPDMNLITMWRSQFGESLGRVYYELRASLPDLPDEIFGPRFGLAWVLTVNALADRERLQAAEATIIRHTLPVLHVSNLMDVLAGIMTAPVSETTRGEILKLRAGGQLA